MSACCTLADTSSHSHHLVVLPPAHGKDVAEKSMWMTQLKKMRETDNAAKALVFSQYRSTIEWLKIRLTQEGFGYRCGAVIAE